MYIHRHTLLQKEIIMVYRLRIFSFRALTWGTLWHAGYATKLRSFDNTQWFCKAWKKEFVKLVCCGAGGGLHYWLATLKYSPWWEFTTPSSVYVCFLNNANNNQYLITGLSAPSLCFVNSIAHHILGSHSLVPSLASFLCALVEDKCQHNPLVSVELYTEEFSLLFL